MSARTRVARGVFALSLALMTAPLVVRSAAGAAPVALPDVTVQVLQVNPSTPLPSNVKQPLTIELMLTNNTGVPIKKVSVLAQRGDPIGNQRALDASLKATTPPEGGFDIAPTKPVSVDLPAESTGVRTAFITSTDIPQDAGICLCHNAVYPLLMSAHVTDGSGADRLLGATTTYLPAFKAKPKPVQVSWVWPLIDRPHRLLDDTVFTDDDLAAGVAGDGRLSRMLRVVEIVGPRVPITLMIDPELLDELEVMATGKYTVQSNATRKDSAGRTVPVDPVAGTGADAARSWLGRLRTVLDSDPQVQVELTPYADPDVESLAAADLPWASVPPDAMSTRIAAALGDHSASNDVAWPAAGVVSRSGLEALATAGARTLILDSAGVRPNVEGDIPSSFATLKTSLGPVGAALTTPALQSYVRSAVTLHGAGAGALPALVAELAVRRDEDLTADRFVLLAPPRYLDPSFPNAVRTILDTSSSPFTTPISLRSAFPTSTAEKATSRPVGTAPLQSGLSTQTLDNITRVSSELSTAEQLLGEAPTAQPLLDAYPAAVQRVSSAAWRADSPLGTPEQAAAQSDGLAQRLEAIFAKVYIVQPGSSGSYTLASSNSPLPITVENDTQYQVRVTIDIRTAGGLPGFTTEPVGVTQIAPRSKQILHIRTHVERSGRIPVVAQLRTVDGAPLGRPIEVSVHSTVLGTVGVVITLVAGTVLAIALLLRLIRQWRTRRTRPAGPTRATKRHLVDSQPDLAQ